MDTLDHDYLESLIRGRDAAETELVRGYLQGRIDEYCSQNAIDASDLQELISAGLDPRLTTDESLDDVRSEIASHAEAVDSAAAGA